MELGTATAAPGERAHGWLSSTGLPTGGEERLPVTLVNGTREGPTLWVTGAIHGDEVTALATAQDVATRADPDALSGALVVVHTLNPAGVRRTTRTSYYHDDDPNRYFPDADVDHYRPPRVQELVDQRIYDAFTETVPADALLDLHTAQVGSVPFVIRDRVLYGDRRDADDARSLAAALAGLADATGIPVVNEYAGDEYTGENLQRSTAGAALNEAGIPALTLELGTHSVVDDDMVALGVAACYRVMVHLDQLDAVPDAAHVPPVVPPVDFPVKRHVGPYTDTAGIVRHRRQPGEPFDEGDPLAAIMDPHGRERTHVDAAHDCYVVARAEGIAAYENDALYSLAILDEGDLVVPRDD